MPKLTVMDIEETYGITSREVRNLMHDGQLNGERNHGVWYIDEASLFSAIEKGLLKDRKKALRAEAAK